MMHAARHRARAAHYRALGDAKRARFHDARASSAALAFGAPATGTRYVFVLAPLNDVAATKLRAVLREATADRHIVAYLQAFSENFGTDPLGHATNVLPAQFNQYSSKVPAELVNIINEFDRKRGGNMHVHFVICPTQLTKNGGFKAAYETALLQGLDAPFWKELSPTLRAQFVSWLSKPKTRADLDDRVASVQEGGWQSAIPTVFDPMCAFAAFNGPDVLSADAKKAAVSFMPKTDSMLTAQRVSSVHVDDKGRPHFTRVETDGETSTLGRTWYMHHSLDNLGLSYHGKTYKNGSDKLVDAGSAYAKYLVDAARAAKPRDGASSASMVMFQDYPDWDNPWFVKCAMYSSNGDVTLYSVGRPVMAESEKRKYTAPMKLYQRVMEWSSNVVIDPQGGAPMMPFADSTGTQLLSDDETRKVKAVDKGLSDADARNIAIGWARMVREWILKEVSARTVTVANCGYPARHGLNPLQHSKVLDLEAVVLPVTDSSRHKDDRLEYDEPKTAPDNVEDLRTGSMIGNCIVVNAARFKAGTAPH